MGDDTITYPVAPVASSDANLAALSAEMFMNGLVFSVEGLGGGGGVDSFDGLLGTGDVVVWGTTSAGIAGVGPSIFRFIWTSKAPNCHIMQANLFKVNIRSMNWHNQNIQ